MFNQNEYRKKLTELLKPMTGEIADMGYITTLIKGENSEGVKNWVFLKIDVFRYNDYLMAINSGEIDLEEFGEILEMGDGEEPPQEAKDRIYKTYGGSDDYEKQLAEKATNLLKTMGFDANN